VAIASRIETLWEIEMRNVLKSTLVAALVLSASFAHAGGPVIIEEGNDAQVEAQTVKSGSLLPVLGVLVLVCLAVCGGGDDPAPVEEKK
jgi:hypothetical protein